MTDDDRKLKLVSDAKAPKPGQRMITPIADEVRRQAESLTIIPHELPDRYDENREATIQAERARDEQEARRKLWKAADFPELHIDFLNAVHNGTVTETRPEWIAKRDLIASRLTGGFQIALVGGKGTGKTQMATSIGGLAYKAGLTTRYTTAMRYFLTIRTAFHPKSPFNELELIDSHIEPQFLVLDEMSVRGEKPWEDLKMTFLIDERYRRKRDTLMLSNETPDAFFDRVGTAIQQRIQETGGLIECDWPSFRRATT